VDIVVRLGAKPILVDINPMNFSIDVEKLPLSVANKTRAVILVHLFGQSAPIDPVLDVVRDRKIPVIEDVAQSTGATYAGRHVGSFGLAGCFSFYPTKNLGCAGDGGCVITNDEELTEKIRILRDHGRADGGKFSEIGYNSRLSALQAAVLRVKLHDLDEMNLERQENARYYNQLLSGLDISLPDIPDDGSHVYNLYTIQTTQRDELRAFLTERGIGTAVYYPVPLHLQPCLKFLGYKEGDFPMAEQVSRRVLQLPVYPGMKRRQLQYVAESVREFFKK
jgi:dTDP-4-amino-4,6-dideoxygalactose transaminase